MDLLDNAVQSIQMGIEDYQRGTQPRLLSAARNIYAGILLLYKEKLRRLSPDQSDEVLLKRDVVPFCRDDGSVSFRGRGTVTVDVHQIRERLSSLGVHSDWDRLKAIQNLRNDIEHYYPRVSREALSGVISNALPIVRDFMTKDLNEDPRTLIGDASWQVLLNVAEIHDAEQAKCQELMDGVDWESGVLHDAMMELLCARCGSGLLRPQAEGCSYGDVVIECRSCGQTEGPESAIPRAIKAAMAGEMYSSVTDGGEAPYAICPDCGAEVYVMEDRRCALCGCEAEHNCELCGTPIPAEELMLSPLCGWCAHMLEKSKDE